MSGDGPVVLAALLAGLLVLGGSIAFGLRVSRSSMNEIRRAVFRVNRALAAAGEATGLRYVGGGEQLHPVVGPVPAYGSLHGVRRGREVHVSIESRDEDSAHLVIDVSPREGAALGAPAPAAGAIQVTEAREARIQVEGGRLLVRWSLPDMPGDLRAAIDDAVAAAEARERPV